MKAESILATIGNTPHIRMQRLFGDAEVWIKSERSNPGGSIKDRIALAMIEAAEASGEPESFHLSQRGLNLLGQALRLVLLRRITRELSRQEVASWKRVIRVISHELNNSLAPISGILNQNLSKAIGNGSLVVLLELRDVKTDGTPFPLAIYAGRAKNAGCAARPSATPSAARSNAACTGLTQYLRNRKERYSG